MRKISVLAAVFSLTLLGVISGVSAIELKQSALEKEFQQVRFESVTAALKGSRAGYAALGDEELNAPSGSDQSMKPFKRKSPLKAFLLSAVVPGVGQLYNGSRIKPIIFLGAEITSWMMHFKYKGDGDDATTAYQDYNLEHWSRETYQQYLLAAYLESDDDSLTGQPGITHHLPGTNTQQFYEMTGKYDQFAWGWDDATRGGLEMIPYLTDSLGGDGGLLRITSASTAPISAHRLTYEGMRKHANDLYNTADTWLYVTIANHLISSFEAFISAKKHNRNEAESDLEFSKVDMKVSLKSYHAWRDTPYVKLSYNF